MPDEDDDLHPNSPRVLDPASRHLGYVKPRSAADATGRTSRQQQQQRRHHRPQAALHALSKHASCALEGVAEAAGHAWLTDLKPYMGQFKREVLEYHLAAGALAVIAAGYALLCAPRHLSWWSDAHLLLTLGYENALTFVLINLLWIYPQLLMAVMWPTFRSSSKSKVHLWQHLAGAVAGGSFALLVYLARWAPPRRGAKLPPTRLTGRNVWLQKLYEGRLWPAVLLAVVVGLLGPLVLASRPATWAQFGYLATQSWLVHVMLLDLFLLVAMAPWLVVKDAIVRSWWPVKHDSGKLVLGLTMLAVPVIGPAVYLLLRPICTEGPGVLEALWSSVQAGSVSLSSRVRPHLSTRGFWGMLQDTPSRHDHRGAAPAGPYGGPVTGAAAAPGQSSTSIAAASAGSTPWQLPGAVEAVARVPLPSRAENLVPSPVRGAVSSVEAVMNDSWHWLGLKIAAARGGGAPIAAPGEAAGEELDANGADGGVSGNTSTHSPGGAAGDMAGGNSNVPVGPASMACYPPPVWHNLQNGGCELQFDDDYEERDFDFDVVTEEGEVTEEAGAWEDSDVQDSDGDDDVHCRQNDDERGQAVAGGGFVATAAKLTEDARKMRQAASHGLTDNFTDTASDGSEGMLIADSDDDTEGWRARRGPDRAAKQQFLVNMGRFRGCTPAAAGRA